MKGSFLWKLAYVFCALAGILAGYGIVSLAGAKEYKPDSITKDSTLSPDSRTNVFFNEEPDIPVQTATPVPTLASTATPIPTAAPTETQAPSPIPESIEILPEAPEITLIPEEIVSAGQAGASIQTELLPSLGSQWVGMGTSTWTQQELPEVQNVAMETPKEQEETDSNLPQAETQEAFTYPAKIFGQTPVINRSDAYVSYFEFCYDLIAMVESEVQARGLNMNALMTKFALKALFCGVDIEQLDINAPIPRRLAALCLWLAAQVLNENGCDTSSQSAERYVTDISSCSASERKAIAYLYELGVVKGYQVAGQRFYPQDGLKTEAGKLWLSGIKQCWK